MKQMARSTEFWQQPPIQNVPCDRETPLLQQAGWLILKETKWQKWSKYYHCLCVSVDLRIPKYSYYLLLYPAYQRLWPGWLVAPAGPSVNPCPLHIPATTVLLRLGLYKLLCSTVAPVALEGLPRIIRVAPRAVYTVRVGYVSR